MAGLQYNFFPADFLYPRTAPKLRTLEKATDLPLQTTKADHAASDIEQLKIQHRGVQVVKIAKSPPGCEACKDQDHELQDWVIYGVTFLTTM
ncbi:hypothetical protein DVH24_011909 [Malus domestica]|uniref:Uncharacterized protein n=1 Tax=Malus domestica TaxID=3750 RepID=A0A498JDF3_MALDO|nr:hypothetical protein DVH24_011909 [Malus domestica]